MAFGFEVGQTAKNIRQGNTNRVFDNDKAVLNFYNICPQNVRVGPERNLAFGNGRNIVAKRRKDGTHFGAGKGPVFFTGFRHGGNFTTGGGRCQYIKLYIL